MAPPGLLQGAVDPPAYMRNLCVQSPCVRVRMPPQGAFDPPAYTRNLARGRRDAALATVPEGDQRHPLLRGPEQVGHAAPRMHAHLLRQLLALFCAAAVPVCAPGGGAASGKRS